MRIKKIYMYIVLITIMLLFGILYNSVESVITYKLYPIVYFAIFMGIIVNAVDGLFDTLLVLRYKNRIKNVCVYIKRIFHSTTIFVVLFEVIFLILTVVMNGRLDDKGIGYYIIRLIHQMIAWNMWAMLYLLMYSLSSNKIVSIACTWVMCIIPSMSNSVLFRLKDIMYKPFKYVEDGAYDGIELLEIDEIIHCMKGILLFLFFVVGILIVHKRRDYIKK